MPFGIRALALANRGLTRISKDCMSENTTFSQVIELLRAEADAIGKTAARLRPEEIDRDITVRSNCKGKDVLHGVGKSGIIAQKLAAKMTSSGTCDIYLLPTDALHGGLDILTA